MCIFLYVLKNYKTVSPESVIISLNYAKIGCLVTDSYAPDFADAILVC